MKIENVVDEVGNRFAAVIVSSRRARQINAYFHQLGEGIGHYVPPQVHSLSRKPLTIAMEEIAEGTDPMDTDTDDGGLPDGFEVRYRIWAAGEEVGRAEEE